MLTTQFIREKFGESTWGMGMQKSNLFPLSLSSKGNFICFKSRLISSHLYKFKKLDPSIMKNNMAFIYTLMIWPTSQYVQDNVAKIFDYPSAKPQMCCLAEGAIVLPPTFACTFLKVLLERIPAVLERRSVQLLWKRCFSPGRTSNEDPTARSSVSPPIDRDGRALSKVAQIIG